MGGRKSRGCRATAQHTAVIREFGRTIFDFLACLTPIRQRHCVVPMIASAMVQGAVREMQRSNATCRKGMLHREKLTLQSGLDTLGLGESKKRNASCRATFPGSRVQMEYFVQQLVNGLTLGSIYGLIAIGYTMVYGIIGMINFAHGDIFMVGSFIALIVFLFLVSVFASVNVVLFLLIMMIVAMLMTSLYNWTIEKVAYRPLRGSFRLAPLITAIGMSIALSNFVQVTQGPRNKPIPPMISTVYDVFGISISAKQIVIVVVTAVLLTLFWYLVNKTSLGRAQRACEQDRKMAALLGIDVDRTISITFIMGASLAAVAGTLYLMYYGVVVLLRRLRARREGLHGGGARRHRLDPGAVLGGLLIGFIEGMWSAYFSIDYKDVAAFSILAIVLIFLPSGILGRPEVEKV